MSTCKVLACLVVVLLWSAACGGGEAGLFALPMPDRRAFELEVGPILARRCGDGGCHGNSARPFALYAVGRRRMKPSPTYGRAPLDDREILANYQATLGFLDDPEPELTTLLAKPLASGGQDSHKGGAVFGGMADPECAAIAAWIRGEAR